VLNVLFTLLVLCYQMHDSAKSEQRIMERIGSG